jgi:putative NADH-flavin reductase
LRQYGLEVSKKDMELLILDATGGTGQQLVVQALEQGHTVTTCAQTGSLLEAQHPNLHIFRCNILDEQAALMTVFGRDIVIVASGSRARGLADLVRGTRNILTAIQQCCVRRSIWVTSFGVGESYHQMGWFARNVIVKSFIRTAIEEKEVQERLIIASDGEWMIVRPGSLTDGPRTGNYRIIPSDAKERIGRPSISRADVADFILKNLTSDIYVRKAVGLTY